MNSDIILSLSVQQTGTWFLLDLITGHPDVVSPVNLIGSYLEDRKGYGFKLLESIVDMWFNERNMSNDSINDYIDEVVDGFISSINLPPYGKKSIFHSHLSRGKNGIRKTTLNLDSPSFQTAFVLKLVERFKTVIPVRDPLRSLLTRQNRHPDLNHEYLVDGFEGLASAFGPNDVFFFPIDLFTEVQSRGVLITELFMYLGLAIDGKAEDYITRVSEHWVRKNTTGHYESKDWYNAGDVDKIRKLIPEEYDRLIKSTPIVKPFLESLGYKDLIWW